LKNSERAKNAANGKPKPAEIPDTPIEFTAATTTLYGDVRDKIIDGFREVPGWFDLKEPQQKRLIGRAEETARKLVGGAVAITAARNHEYLVVRCGGFAAEKELKIKIAAAVTDENLKTVRKFYGAEALIVLASHHVFMGERAKAEPDNIGELGIPRPGGKTPAERVAEGSALIDKAKLAETLEHMKHDADGVFDDDPELPDTTEHAAPDWRKNVRA
jgi:hypothetical protein